LGIIHLEEERGKKVGIIIHNVIQKEINTILKIGQGG